VTGVISGPDRTGAHGPSGALPSGDLIIARLQRGDAAADKLANLRAIDYPRERFGVMFVSDSSTDRTNDILRAVEDPAIRVLVLPNRSGKCHALNIAVAAALAMFSVFRRRDPLRPMPSGPSSATSDSRVGAVCGPSSSRPRQSPGRRRACIGATRACCASWNRGSASL
jgi:hypothetical protein